MYKIYLLENIDGLKYVGKTKQTIKQRLSAHTCNSKQCETKSSKLVVSKPFTVTILEECEKDISKEREAYWINHYECVNYLKLNHNKKKYNEEWNQNNKEYYKQYHQENKEKRHKQRNNIRKYQESWGGQLRNEYKTENCCLLKIDPDLFN
jgi:hypothetical protein